LGCAVNPVTGRREIILMSPEREAELGRQGSEQVASEIGLVEAPALAQYVDAVGKRVASHSPRGNVTYSVQVVQMPESNAFALPGGYTYVSRGLLALANSEDELANVIAHEVGHVAARHAAQRETRAMGAGLLAVLGTIAASALGGEEAAQTAAQVGQVAAAGLIATYSRDQEREADRVGQSLAAKGGYDPAAMADFLGSLERETALHAGGARLPSFFDSHPSTPERASAAAALARTLPRRPGTPIAATRADFLARLEGLLLGGDPAEGIFRDDVFLHPDLDFRLRLPSDWTAQNTRAAVRSIAPQGAALIELTGAGSGDDPRTAAERDLAAQGLSATDAGATRIHGLQAFRARTLVSTQQGSLGLDLTWIAHRGAIYRVQGAAPEASFAQYSELFGRTAGSFRPLTPEEVRSITERRLHVTAAREGEDLTQLSSRTGNAWSPGETAVMNGLPEGVRLRAGQPVKVARDRPYRP
jgi:predicted Zn-dependent protease